jgi:hypothetical protein
VHGLYYEHVVEEATSLSFGWRLGFRVGRTAQTADPGRERFDVQFLNAAMMADE